MEDGRLGAKRKVMGELRHEVKRRYCRRNRHSRGRVKGATNKRRNSRWEKKRKKRRRREGEKKKSRRT